MIEMNNHKKQSGIHLLTLALDFILLNIAFVILVMVKYKTFRLESRSTRMLFVFYSTWVLIACLSKKFKARDKSSFINELALFTRDAILLTYFISLVVVLKSWSDFSRIHLFGTCLLYLVLQVIMTSLFFLFAKENASEKVKIVVTGTPLLRPKLNLLLLVYDLIMLVCAFLCLNYFKRGELRLSPQYDALLLIMLGLWLVSSLLAKKFDISNFQNYYYAMAACIKAILLMSFTMSVLIFAFRLFRYSRFQIFGTFILLFIFELMLYYVYYILYLKNGKNGDIDTVEKIQDHLYQEALEVESPRIEADAEPSYMNVIYKRLFQCYPHLNEFISQHIRFTEFNTSEIAIMNSPDLLNIHVLENTKLQLLTNVYRLNDIRWINRYLLDVHSHLRNGGCFIGLADTIDIHKRQFFKKYPKYLAEVFYLAHFLLFRVSPKLPYIKKLYFSLTKGKNRMISRAEILGRLYFCGFKVIAEQELQGSLYFVAQKTKTPSLDQNPSYGPLIQLKRTGYKGQFIYVFKFRTMYPYSEYLQPYIYQLHDLHKGGKIYEDFRVTGWGKLLRKYWIDELPMLYNWFKGDLKLFGVRPLSNHYLSLYDRHLRRMRRSVKPGLIPPYYADLPNHLEEISDSEKKYIMAYNKKPLNTQIRYFFRAVSNIVFKGARSR